MALPAPSTMTDWLVHGQIIDVSTASIAHIAVGARGRLTRAYVCLSAAVTIAGTVITIKKASTAIGTITITVADSGVGSVHEAILTGAEADLTFADNTAVVFDCDGDSTTTSIGRITAVFRRL